MSNYSVNITNGSGSKNMKAGNYNVTVDAVGYDNATLNPNTHTVPSTAGSGTFTLTANGTLTFNVNETGASGGTPVTSGSIVMTDSSGTTQYGTAVNIDSSGNAVFNNVPYGNGSSPITLYFIQLSTDENHNVYEGVISVNMSSETQTEYITNLPIAMQTFTLTDGTYTGLPVGSATMTFTSV